MGRRGYDAFITIHQSHSLSIEEIHHDSLPSYVRAPLRAGWYLGNPAKVAAVQQEIRDDLHDSSANAQVLRYT